MATSITFTFNNARDIHLAIDQLRALEQTVPQDVTITQTHVCAPCQPERAERVSLSNAGLLEEFRQGDYEFRTASGLYDDIGHHYESKDDLTRHLEGLVSDGALRTARRSRDGVRLYALA